MIRLGYRQFRTQAWVSIGLLVVVGVLFASTGPHIAHIYDVYAKAQAACVASSRCGQVNIDVGLFDRLLELIGTALVAVPGLIGAFWGAPLITRELEQGTHRLVWTQSVSRNRWLAVKLALVGAASIVATGLLSLMVTWWSSPIDHADLNRFGSGVFGERDITPLGYAAFACALGVTAGVLIRRTLPSMAATLAIFIGVRIAFTYLIRPHLLAPIHRIQPLTSVVDGFGQRNAGSPTLFAHASNLPNAWIYSTRIVDSTGHGLTSETVVHACPTLLEPPPGLDHGSTGAVVVHASSDAGNALQGCIATLSPTYHGIVAYQPASRYWLFQSIETGIFLAGALALSALCFYAIHRRAWGT